MKPIILMFLLAVYCFGIHTQLSITSGGKLLVPFALTGMVAAGIVALTLDRISLNIVKLIGFMAVILYVLALAHGIQSGELVQRLLTTTNLVYSIGLAYVGFVAIEAIGMKKANTLFGILAFVLIAGAYLEIVGVVRPVSDAFREETASLRPSYADTYGGVMGDVRDETQYGHLRPKFFGSEPSALGVSTGVAILFWFLSTASLTRIRMLKTGLICAVAFYAGRSPSVLIFGSVAGVLYLSEIGVVRSISKMRKTVLAAGLLLAVVGIPFIVSTFMSYGQSISFFQREILPLTVFLTLLRTYPIMGTGVGGYSAAADLFYSAISEGGSGGNFTAAGMAMLHDAQLHGGGRIVIANHLFEYWAALGIFGGILVLMLFLKLLKILRVPNSLFVICLVGSIWTATPGFGAPAPWIILLSVSILYRQHWESKERYPMNYVPVLAEDNIAGPS